MKFGTQIAQIFVSIFKWSRDYILWDRLQKYQILLFIFDLAQWWSSTKGPFVTSVRMQILANKGSTWNFSDGTKRQLCA
jgi:hypothetical protein